ncbi:hypothetical protein AGLY_003773 [Aphis glycines]|uniref:Uncharacterized protein n=1 Tax=Aphis glycines TaxID=307491 RepID=A0A6G0TZA8_APHGL|nr:hypothetical protein AGLY_003773 [Aphis glycines]
MELELLSRAKVGFSEISCISRIKDANRDRSFFCRFMFIRPLRLSTHHPANRKRSSLLNYHNRNAKDNLRSHAQVNGLVSSSWLMTTPNLHLEGTMHTTEMILQRRITAYRLFRLKPKASNFKAYMDGKNLNPALHVAIMYETIQLIAKIMGYGGRRSLIGTRFCDNLVKT